MRTYDEKLKSLNENSVWIFTKQDVDFDIAFKAARLFKDIPDKEHTNIENYFIEHHQEYGIPTDRHRVLVISQLYGLITKSNFYVRGGNYSSEKTTSVFDEHMNCEIGSKEYNTFKTEQILKVKIHAIVDTANNNYDYNILPIVFIYDVLQKLKENKGINEITIDQLYTYVLTCKSYSELDEAVEFIAKNCPISRYVATYKDRSRILPFIRKNTNLFVFRKSKRDNTELISINSNYEQYAKTLFETKYSFAELNDQVKHDLDYSYFLYTSHNFDIDLIDLPQGGWIVYPKDPKKPVSTYIDDEDESDYLNKVDALSEDNINLDIGKDAYKVEPSLVDKTTSKRRYKVNPILGKNAIIRSNYQCECNKDHTSFCSKRTGKPYMEAHHLIPVCNQKDIWDNYQVNIDCLENIVSLCPTCHKAFHYGTDEVKSQMIETMFNVCKLKYEKIGFNITLEEIKNLYNIKTKK